MDHDKEFPKAAGPVHAPRGEANALDPDLTIIVDQHNVKVAAP